eukprot:8250215-Alexandrium_andersonii.AAC.1
MSASLVGSEMCIRDRPDRRSVWALCTARRPKARSASCARPISAAIRLNPQPALPKMRSCLRRATLERSGPNAASNLAPEAPKESGAF